MRLFSHGKIGIAPIVAYSYDEDYRAAKLPPQLFASAIERCRLQLQSDGLGELLSFTYLPPSLRVVTGSYARFVRLFFGFDVLLWGSFGNGERREVWINFARGASPDEIREAAEKRRKKIEIQYFSRQQQLFDGSLRIDFPAISVAEDDPTDAYIAVCTAVCQMIVYRRDLPGYLSLHDRLRLFSDSETLVPLKLLQDCFFDLPIDPIHSDNPQAQEP